MRWVAVVPVKALPSAKSRLAPRSDGQRERLALAFARDTIEAALGTEVIDEVVVVTSDPRADDALRGPGVVILAEPQPPDLNAALASAAALAAERDTSRGVVALCADLPALQGADLGAALRLAEPYARSFVADASGVGTTLLAAGPGHVLSPRFGARSAALHTGSGAEPLPGALSSLRQDVDSPEDLAAAVALGVGRWTASALGLH